MVNTDGVAITIKKSSKKDIFQILDDFEKYIGIKIDPREEIKRGLFFSSNKRYLQSSSGDWLIKGELTFMGLPFVTNLFTLIMEKNLNLSCLLKKLLIRFTNFF